VQKGTWSGGEAKRGRGGLVHRRAVAPARRTAQREPAVHPRDDRRFRAPDPVVRPIRGEYQVAEPSGSKSEICTFCTAFPVDRDIELQPMNGVFSCLQAVNAAVPERLHLTSSSLFFYLPEKGRGKCIAVQAARELLDVGTGAEHLPATR
jgi:hypothetical protein